MARARGLSPVGFLTGLFRRRSRSSDAAVFHRTEERRRASEAATQQWLALLREMEHNGETDEPRYETYYRAYLQSKQQEKRADLELFNLRQGLT
ncbi:MAG TPA: hypothetical protein VF221_02870 [Chloroflexota bacterium]